jgi:hypothetical protein
MHAAKPIDDPFLARPDAHPATKSLISMLKRTVSGLNEREKLVSGLFLTERTQHGRRYCRRVLLFDSAHHHAQMSRFNDYSYA